MKKQLIVAIVIVSLGAIIGFLELSRGETGEPLFSKNFLSSNPSNQVATKPAPDFQGIYQWLNSAPLKINELKGKVVLVDFWTYSCINCIRTLPYVTSWYEKYKDQGLVIVGVHTPEFDFERRTENVRDAIKRYKITYPVAQDNDYATWQAYENRYWPAKYLIDQSGQIVYTHFGEGKYEETENQIRKLLGLSGQADTAEDKRSMAKTPEIYFGLLRQEFFASQTPPAPKATVYEFPDHIPANHFSLEGEWRFEKEFAELVGPSGKIGLNFYASKVHLVAESKHGKPIKVRVTVDGVMRRELEIAGADLYTLAELEKPGEHILEIEVLSPGLLVFTFTFG